jgi:hypothetical protein
MCTNFQQQRRPGNSGSSGAVFLPSSLGKGTAMVVGIIKHHPQFVFAQESILVPVSKYSTMVIEAPY